MSDAGFIGPGQLNASLSNMLPDVALSPGGGALASSTVSAGAAGLSAVGSLLSGIGSLVAGNHKATAERYAATQANDEAGVNAQIALQEGDQVAADAAVQAAANGGGFVGSSLAVLSSLSQQAMFNARAQVYRGRSEAQQHLYNAKVAKAQGRLGLVTGILSAGASLATLAAA